MTKRIVLQTDRLILREWCPDDAPAFAQINADTKVMEFFPSTLSRHESDQLIAKASQQIVDYGFSYWAAELKTNQNLIGFIGLQRYEDGLPFAPCVDIGWRLASKYWGQGLATEGARATLNYGFEQLGIDEIVSMTSIHNFASERVMQKIGLIKEPAHFMHPKLDVSDPLAEHVLYRLKRPDHA